MMTIRKSQDRGHAVYDWLQTKHTFSFADYYDPNQLGFRVLRVINEDRIAPQTGFPMHSHRDMEIITYVIEGALEHEDNMGNSAVIRPGEVQRMTAGTGVVHSERNYLTDQTTHLLQIWITPDRTNYSPDYGQKSFFQEMSKSDLVLVASRHGRDGSLTINQDIDLYIGKSRLAGETVFKGVFDYQWIQMIKGEIQIDHQILNVGDGVAISNMHELNLRWSDNSEFLLFDII